MSRVVELSGEHFHVSGGMDEVQHVPNVNTAEGWMLHLLEYEGHKYMAEQMELILVQEFGKPGTGDVDELDDYITEKGVPASRVAEVFNHVQAKYLQTKEANCAESQDGNGWRRPNRDPLQGHSRWGNHTDAHSGRPQSRPK